MKKSCKSLAIGLLFSLPAMAQSSMPGDQAILRHREASAVRAQLVPLKKGVFSAGISGIVQQIAVQEGDLVQEGELLLAFDCADIEATQKTAQARVDSAIATLEVNRELVKLNSVGPLEVKLNEAELAIAEGQLDQARAKLKHCQVRAPFSGAITQRTVEAHQFVEEGMEMLELVSSDELEVRMLLPSTALAWLKTGGGFSMFVEELEERMDGTVVRIGGAVDPVSLTVPVFGKLTERRAQLLPGMSGQVQFRTEGRQP